MLDLKQLTATLEGGEIPPSFDAKTIGKISKRFLQWKVARVVNLYPIRGVSHEDSRYCLYACPLNGTTIDEETLRAIHAEIDSLEIGHIRYDSVQSEGADYYILDEHGNHCGMDADDDIVAMISDRFDGLVLFTKTVFSPKKAAQLDCHYAALGISKEPNGYTIEPLSNTTLGLAASSQRFRGPKVEIPDAGEESPAVEKYRQTMTLVMELMLIAAVIWYLIKG